MLSLTWKEIENIMQGKYKEHFSEMFDDIPFYHPDNVAEPGESARSYKEDDGRERRMFIFEDVKTKEQYTINYTYHRNWDNEIDDLPDNIELVENSVLNLSE